MAIAIPIWSEDFLESDIREQDEYKASIEDSSEFDAFLEAARESLNTIQGVHEPDEEITIELAIGPILDSLGWPARRAKRSLTSRDEVDLAIYADADESERLLAQPERAQVLGATGIVECKRWRRDFDASGSGSRAGETAAQQTQRYLLIGSADSGESLRWGILTNGARWRLYSARARPRERSWEIDLAALLATTDLFSQVLADDAIHHLRTAFLLLRRDSWVPAEGERESFIDRLLEAGRHRNAEVADDLSDVIFKNVYPEIVRLFWTKRPEETSDRIARAALLFLYRLLFLYYAEDRNILDTDDASPYRPYSLRHGVRDPVAERHGKSEFSTRSRAFWQHLSTLRDIIDQGDPAIDVPPYNGGLFQSDHVILDELELSDAELAPIIHDLSHTSSGVYVSYRNLEVQQLGSIYERLLEQVPNRDSDDNIVIAVSPYARKDSGSYYTPQELVDLIVEQTLRPLVDERIQAFRDRPSDALDPAGAILKLRVLDPAMGSGHFLITAIDWLTRELASLADREWDEKPGHVSPVREQLWQLQETYPALSDETLLQRMVLKRCIYGVDKNPMAVELAQVALWLHTFTGDLPLPHLEHRIVEGDSLLGIRGDQAEQYISEWGEYPLGDTFDEDVRGAASQADQVDEQLDMTIDEVRQSLQLSDSVDAHRTDRQRRVLNLVAGLRWQSAGMKQRERKAFHEPLARILRGDPGRAISVLYNGESRGRRSRAGAEYANIRDAAFEIVERENILHWEIAFPHVMLEGGFDAVIGNPPWDKIKLEDIEWWTARNVEVAKVEPKAKRDQVIAERRDHGDPMVAQYDEANRRAGQLSKLVTKSGDYPLLGAGDINLYGLFVERSLSLLKPDGICGLLTPSGIFADKTCAPYFRSISTAGRLGSIFDFQNRRSGNPDDKNSKWFPEVHPQFKFCATVTGGADRRFGRAECGFFLDGLADLHNPDRVFSFEPSDFVRMNPNTGTGTVIRDRRDADILSRIYRHHPVLVDRSSAKARSLFPVRYHRMFDMSNDSNLFVTAVELEAAGAYKVIGNRFKRGTEEWLPLFQGRIIGAFDHRENSVGFNPRNVRRPYVSIRTTLDEHRNPDFVAGVQSYVPLANCRESFHTEHRWVIAYRRSSKETNSRGMIATIGPEAAYADSVFLYMAAKGFNAVRACFIVANFNSFAADFVLRKKLQGTNLSKYIVEQLPMIHPDDYDCKFGAQAARDLVRDHVLRLTYTAYDLTPFARDLGYEGEPFIWDPAERRQLHARLDALYFHLYGLSEDDADYILDQFPVLAKNERKEFGHYLTKHLVLNHYRALAAGDTEAVIAENVGSST